MGSVLIATASFLVLCAVSQTTDGKLAPALLLNGKSAEGACSFTAKSATGTFESASGTALNLPAGEYALAIACKLEGETVLAPAPDVKVIAGKTATPKVDVRLARVRVEARRNGVMLPAKVLVLAPGNKEPMHTFSANQKQTIAQGRYDFDVRLEDPKSPAARVLLNGKTVGGTSVTVIEADLSDGGLIVTATMNGKTTGAAVRVFAPGSEKDLASVETGEEIRLPAGRYIVSSEARDNADFTTKKRDVWINAGKTVRFAENFESGMLSVAVTREGRPVDATVRLSLPMASDFFNHFAAPGTVMLSPGTYAVSIESAVLGPVKSLEKRDLKVARGAHQKVAFDLTQATLAVQVTKDGQRYDAEVHVRAAGGGEDAGAGDMNNNFKLWPGRYEIVAMLPDGTELLDGPFEVVLGQKISRELKVVRGTLVVNAMRGKSAAADAEILVFRPGATKPTAKGRAGAKLEIPPGVYDVKVVAGKDVAWHEGLKLKTTQTIRVDLPLLAGGPEEAMPEGDLLPPGDEMPEGDSN
jgi:hypothetical protein